MKQFVIGIILLILFFSGGFSFTMQAIVDFYNYIAKLIQGGVLGSVFYIFVLLLDSLYTPKLKSLLVHWCNGLPAYTAFSGLLNGTYRDPRINIEEAKEKYKDIFSQLDDLKNKSERKYFENAAWYKIYSHHKDNGAIRDANRSYLAYQDMSIASINMLILYLIISGLLRFPITCQPVIILIVLYFLTRFAARNKGKRLITNTFACDLAEEHEKENEVKSNTKGV